MSIHNVSGPTWQETTTVVKTKRPSMFTEGPVTKRPRRIHVVSSPTFSYEIPIVPRPRRRNLAQARLIAYDEHCSKYRDDVEEIRARLCGCMD